MTILQDDLFGGSSIVGASRSVRALEQAQCLGQTDVFSQLEPATPAPSVCDDCGEAAQYLTVVKGLDIVCDPCNWTRKNDAWDAR